MPTYPAIERLLRPVKPEARSRELTQAEKAQEFLEEQLRKVTTPARARRLSMTAFGGADSGIPGGMGAVDFVPFLGSAKGLEEGVRDVNQAAYDLESGRYGDAARNYGAAVLGVLPGAAGAVKVAPGLAKAVKAAPLDEAGALTKPLTKKQFEKQFAQHIDIRGRENKNQEDNMRAILEEGFRRGFGPNAVPPYAGGAPLNIMSERFRPQSGDVVYLAPQNAWQKTPNGMKIAEGWKPEPEHIVRVQDPNQSMYEAYLANFNKSKGALTREAPQAEATDAASMYAVPKDYRGSHIAPGPHYGAPLHDVSSGGMYPSDFYGPNGRQYYSNEGWDFDANAFNKVLHYKNKPDAKVTIFRAVPKSVYKEAMKSESPIKQLIQPGDWITLSKEYAKAHGESALNNDYKIVQKMVPARQVWTNADSIHEWGYHPDTPKETGEGALPKVTQ